MPIYTIEREMRFIGYIDVRAQTLEEAVEIALAIDDADETEFVEFDSRTYPNGVRCVCVVNDDDDEGNCTVLVQDPTNEDELFNGNVK